MAFQNISLTIVDIPVEDLTKLFVNFQQIAVKTDDGEVIYLDGVSDHDAYSDSAIDFRHKFESLIHRNGKMPQWAEIEIESEENLIFKGTITYQETNGDNLSE